MVTLSKVALQSGGTEYEFTYLAGNFGQTIEKTYVAAKPDRTSKVKNAEGRLRKELNITIAFLTDDVLGNTAAQKFFSFLNFIGSNVDKVMTLTLQLDGGNTVKTYNGKFVSKQTGQIISDGPNEVITSFAFIVQGASW
jgi:hypothetical protein